MRQTKLIPLLLLAALNVAAGEKIELVLDASKEKGVIRPLHGGNCGPLQFGDLLDLTEYHKALGIPYTRLHDCHWPSPDVVDIHVVFPNFDADPENPASYDFRRTDDYIQSVLNTGAKIVYRLGESIEHSKRKYHVHPPKDPAKWAAICAGIIRHYNEGWGNGFKHGIQYWEIWNEPENKPAMWTGTDEQFFELYEVTAKELKKRFPNLKIGGPALGHSLDFKEGEFRLGAYAKTFLDRCRDRAIPLDFFSWHLYTNRPGECTVRATVIRRELDARGFQKTESHLNEWNYLPDNDWGPIAGTQGQGLEREKYFEKVGGAAGAAFTAHTLITLQDAPVDIANFYLNDNNGFGMFSYHGVPRKNYFSTLLFSGLPQNTRRLDISAELPKGIAVLGAISNDKDSMSILIANYGVADPEIKVRFKNVPWESVTEFLLLSVNPESPSMGGGPVKQDGELVDISSYCKAMTTTLLTISSSKKMKPEKK